MTSIDELVKERIRQVNAYNVQQFPCPVVLDANESPYPPPKELLEKLWVVMAGTQLNRYPDMDCTPLRNAISQKEGANQREILLGNGSDELVQSLIITVCEPGDKILTPTPTFVMYETIANFLGVDCVSAPLADDWSLDMDNMLELIKEHDPKIIFIASPNNPTGRMYSHDDIKTIIDAAGGLVVIDEAYIDFAEKPYGLLYQDHPNVVIMRTLSKSGLAAARLGYIMADQKLVTELNKVRLPYNINSMTQAVAAEVIRSWDLLKPSLDEIVSERERVFEELDTTYGITAFPSSANFILIRVKENPKQAFKKLIAGGVRVRWFEHDERLNDCFRITIGNPDQNDRLLTKLEDAVY